MIPLLLILGLFGTMIFVFVGLNLSENIKNSVSYALFWVVYVLVGFTLINMFLLSYFWAVIRKKTGPPGIRGPKGDTGKRGFLGKCDMKSPNAICMVEVSKLLDELYKKELQNELDKKRLEVNVNYDDLKKEEDKIKNMTILNKDNTLINGFMRRKVVSICKSVQFDILNDILVQEGKGPHYLIDYIKNILKEWFYLIYEQNKLWFTDPDAIQKYEWKDKNPFNEIKKYDIYYWGDTRRFRPLKNNICKTGLHENSTYPSSQESRIKMIKSNDYQEVYDDNGSTASRALKVFRPNKRTYNENEYFPIGDIAVSGNLKNRDNLGKKKNNLTRIGDLEYDKSDETDNGPDEETILITGDVRSPERYELMWRDQKYGASWADQIKRDTSALMSLSLDDDSYGPGRLWKPIGPQGYTCLGDVATNYYPPNHSNRDEYLKHNKDVNIKCVPNDCVEEIDEQEVVNNERVMWQLNRDTNSDIVFNGTVYKLGDNEEATGDNSYNIFRTTDFSYIDNNGQVISKNGDKFYRIKQSCLNGAKQTIKDVESQFENIGIGWYGNPSNNIPKYSIFHFMGLVPEGVIENLYTYKKYYIVHYGGMDLNCYNIYTFNESNGKYDMAFEIDDLGDVFPRKIKKGNLRQQWKINKIEEKLYFENKFNGKYLIADLESRERDFYSVDNINIESNQNMAYLFSFNPAFGTSPK